MSLVYIAHPLDGLVEPWTDRRRNYLRYLSFVAAVSAAGDTVIGWAHHEECARLGMLPDGDRNFYMQHDLRLLRAADSILVCAPPNVSHGVDEERRVAGLLGKPQYRPALYGKTERHPDYWPRIPKRATYPADGRLTDWWHPDWGPFPFSAVFPLTENSPI